MSDWPRSRWRYNPAFWYVAAGFGLLAFSLWIPWLSASRTTRVEQRADNLAEALLHAARGFEPSDDGQLDEARIQAVLARFYQFADSRGLRLNHIERVEPTPEGALLCLRNKHYAIQLTVSPPDATQRPGLHTVPALEVTAWPLRQVGPGHCAFFYPENAERAYTRNLRKGYAGLEDGRPLPGHCHRRPGLGSRRPSQYASGDDERWILY